MKTLKRWTAVMLAAVLITATVDVRALAQAPPSCGTDCPGGPGMEPCTPDNLVNCSGGFLAVIAADLIVISAMISQGIIVSAEIMYDTIETDFPDVASFLLYFIPAY